MLNKISIFEIMKMFLIILLALPFELLSQNFERLTNNEYGFSIDKPRTWVMWEMQEIKNNFTKFDFTAKQKGDIMTNTNQAVLIFSFGRSNRIKKGETMVPLVQIYLRSNPETTFDGFEGAFTRSINEDVRPLFKEFEYLEQPSRIELDGKQAVSMLTKSKLLHNGTEVISRSRVIAVPKGSYFFQISFIDGDGDYDCQELFLKIIDSIDIED